ncbi:MAG: hypothetical protein MUE67_06940 [Anaerolineales bacterium]|jgi:uncharacterized spore protein YtfJ|nr:hypothetical protein [Anaerolineales bacterium]
MDETDNTTPEEFDDDFLIDEDDEFEWDGSESSDSLALSIVEDNIDRFMATASVDAVFGEPFETEKGWIIPIAEVGSAMGFGVGTGSGQDEKLQGGSGSGGGGGGWNFSRPVAVVVASAEGVQVQPVIDVTKIALAALTTAGFMLGLLAKMARPQR